jgi:hypothetical protein
MRLEPVHNVTADEIIQPFKSLWYKIMLDKKEYCKAGYFQDYNKSSSWSGWVISFFAPS